MDSSLCFASRASTLTLDCAMVAEFNPPSSFTFLMDTDPSTPESIPVATPSAPPLMNCPLRALGMNLSALRADKGFRSILRIRIWIPRSLSRNGQHSYLPILRYNSPVCFRQLSNSIAFESQRKLNTPLIYF